MPLHTKALELSIQGGSEITDITRLVQEELCGSSLSDGLVTVFVPGTSGGVVTLEYEQGPCSVADRACEDGVPQGVLCPHGREQRGGDGYTQARMSRAGPSLSIPFRERRLSLEAWQQIAFVDDDNRPRRRVLILQIMGD